MDFMLWDFGLWNHKRLIFVNSLLKVPFDVPVFISLCITWNNSCFNFSCVIILEVAAIEVFSLLFFYVFARILITCYHIPRSGVNCRSNLLTECVSIKTRPNSVPISEIVSNLNLSCGIWLSLVIHINFIVKSNIRYVLTHILKLNGCNLLFKVFFFKWLHIKLNIGVVLLFS